MSENNFDKHIFDEMSNLRIKPGHHVWGQIQADIRRRRRRRLVGILLPLLLIGSISAFWLMNQSDLSQTQLANNNTEHDQNSTLLNNPDSLDKSNNLGQGNIPDDKEIIASIEAIEPIHSTQQNEVSTMPKSNDSKDLTIVTKTAKPVQVTSQFRNAITEQNLVNEVVPIAAIANSKESELEEHSIHSIRKSVIDIAKMNEQINVLKASEQYDLTSVFPKEEEPILNPNTSVNRQWKFGIHASLGEGGVGNGSLGESIFKSSMVYNSSPGEGSGNYYTNKVELKHHSKKYYHAGFWAAKPINNRLSIQSGLDYQYFSTSTNVGWRIIEERFVVANAEIMESPMEVYYAPGSRNFASSDQLLMGFAMPIEPQNFNNYWHVISVPVQVNYLVTPVNANYGVSLMANIRYQRLLAEEILHFDEKNGIMFRLDGLVNKNQFMFNTGLNIELFKKNRFPVNITPNIGYQVNQFYKPSLKTNHHSWVGGVTVGVQLF